MSTKASRSAPTRTARSTKKRAVAAGEAPSPGGPSNGAASGAPANGKRERNKAQNRTDILSAAREVFTELGYDAATVRDIIRRTELASGTFYNYFPDKQSVFRALLRESEERRIAWLSRVDRRGTDFDRYLRASFRAYFEFVVADRTTFDLIRRNAETIRAFARDEVLVDERARLRRSLLRDMTEGFIPETEADFLASAIIGVSFEVAVLMVERDPVDIDAAADFVTDLFAGFFARVRRGDRAKDARRTAAARA